MNEVFDIAKNRYETAAAQKDIPQSTQSRLASIVNSLGSFHAASSKEELAKSVTVITSELGELTSSAGYTTRPAFSELLKSFRAFHSPESRDLPISVDGKDIKSQMAYSLSTGDKNWKLDSSARKLLAARTYTALAQEVETTNFQVLPQGKR